MPETLATPEVWSDGAVLVTGGSGEIGIAIARAFLQRGARVALVGSTQVRIDGALAALAEYGDAVTGLAADLREPVATWQVFDQVEGRFGTVRVLVNGTGINYNQAISAIVEAEYDRVMDTNVKAAFFASQLAAERLVAAGKSGRVINITSGNYRYARPNAALYAASKAALEMLTRSFALEYGPSGITFNAIAPGLVSRSDEPPPQFARVADFYQANSPLGRLVAPADVATVALFLASEQAALITGETIVLDAGFSAGRFDFPRRSQ
jgi:NAD(P)-dependent dehydrogenase (short-subunit alcohol dehydrogenase family)